MNEKTTTEIEIEVSAGRITEAHVMPDGKCKLVIELTAPKGASTVVSHLGDTFVKVEASKLSLNDKFMMYMPDTQREEMLMKMIKDVITSGPKDFWRPKYDPSFNKAVTGICYKAGRAPAVGKSYGWWKKVAKEFKPECKSRLGTKSEYIAFLAVLIKKLVENGWTVAKAWRAVCSDSQELGHYINSENAKKGLEATGCREVCGFFDLANTYKILAEDEEKGKFWLASGGYINGSGSCPLADLGRQAIDEAGYYNGSCGWIVLDCCSG